MKSEFSVKQNDAGNFIVVDEMTNFLAEFTTKELATAAAKIMTPKLANSPIKLRSLAGCVYA